MKPPEPTDAGMALAGTADGAAAGARLLQAGRYAEARAILEAAARDRPRDGRLLNNLAIARQRCGDSAGASAALQQALSCAGEDAPLLQALGGAFMAQGCGEQAAVALRRALRELPEDAALWHRYGRAVERSARPPGPAAEAEAGAAFRRAIALDSGQAGAWRDLGSLLYRQGRLQAAAGCWRCAVAADPGLADAHLSLAIACRDQGRIAAAWRHLGNAAAAAPQRRDLLTQQIFTLDFDPAQDSASQQRARRAWAAAHAPAASGQRVHPRMASDPDPDRLLRIGYVSADFNMHSAATTFAAPILHHDRARFHLTCYSTRAWRDGMTDRFRAAAAAWRDLPDADEAALAQQVRDDRIDILVDLSGHSPGHRLGAFARRPAPLQVSGWGHCTGTGMTQMDALLVDPVMVPVAERASFAETIVDLPCALSYLPFETPPDAVPAAGLLAHRRATPLTAPVVFGALGRGGKLGFEAVRLWARVLHAVSDSRLHLKDHQYRCRGRRRDIALQFAARGIDPSRLTFDAGTDWAGHMQAYWRVDIALDTLPHGGGVTTLEALWMGVPVVSLPGRFPSARIGAAILTACGLADCVAGDPAQFVAIAQRLAAGVADLRAGRAALRERLRRTPPYDPAAYARAVEAAYRALWQVRCAAAGAR